MIDALSFIGEPLKFTDRILIYPPTIREVLKNNSLLQTYKILTQSQEDVIDLLQQKNKDMVDFPTPFEFLLGNCYNSKSFESLILQGMKLILHKEVYFLYKHKLIIIGTKKELLEDEDNDENLLNLSSLNDENFFAFQNSLRLVFGDEPIQDYIKEDPLVEQIKAKSRLREKRAKKRKEKNGDSFINSISSICLMNCGVTPFNVGDLPYSALSYLIQKYQAKEKYEQDMLMISGGADPKKIKPKYWLKSDNKQENAEDILKNFS